MLISGFDPSLVPASVEVDDTTIRVTFTSGLQVASPLARFPRLQRASAEQQKKWRLIGKGDGIHWPEIDEDISVKGFFTTPNESISSAIEEVPYLIGELYKTTRRLNSLFQGRPFTPDGHLVGSIGEVVAEYIYDLLLEPCSTPHVDAHTHDGRSVQIKLTGETGRAYGIRWSNERETLAPDLLLCLKLTSQGFAEVYNGPFPLELLRTKRDQKNGQIALSVTSLLTLNPSVLQKANSFSRINRWFTPELAEVA